MNNPVTFFEGRPLAEFPPREMEDAHVVGCSKYAAEKGETVNEAWLRIGLRNGWVSGWHAGFRAASGMEAPLGGETVKTGSTEGDSPVPKADAQPSSTSETP